MRSSSSGRDRLTSSEVDAQPGSPLSTARVRGARADAPRALGRRRSDFVFARIFIPSLIVDHTELALRQAGVHGAEGFAVWAGTLSGGDAHISTLVVPGISGGALHGEVSAETTANVLVALDERDLVPVMQVHSHPRRAYLSETDAIRPLVAVAGFISVVIPRFGFVDLADVGVWSAHEYDGQGRWRELGATERRRRLVIDDSLIVID